MQRSDKPWIELAKAEKCAAELEVWNAEERHAAWIAFLHAIERVWLKAFAHYKNSPKWSSWHAPYLEARKKDPLLAYLVNARGADEHTNNEVARRVSGTVEFKNNSDRPVHLQARVDRRTPSYIADGPITVTKVDGQVFPLAIHNRGRTYLPPTSHMGDVLQANNAAALAAAGIAYYRAFLEAAEAEFVK